jgi:hypothetical protein
MGKNEKECGSELGRERREGESQREGGREGGEGERERKRESRKERAEDPRTSRPAGVAGDVTTPSPARQPPASSCTGRAPGCRTCPLPPPTADAAASGAGAGWYGGWAWRSVEAAAGLGGAGRWPAVAMAGACAGRADGCSGGACRAGM